MNFQRGQIVYHNFPLPGKAESELHPVLILSNETVTIECDMYVGLMITSSENYQNDYFTFELEDKMIMNNKLPKENKFIRLHLIAYFNCNKVNSEVKGTVKDSFIDIILDSQRDRVFSTE